MSTETSRSNLQKFRVALDWAPNVIHSGLFVSKMKGFYEKEGLDVEFITPDLDNSEYQIIDKLKNKEVDVALLSNEELIYSKCKYGLPIKSIGAVLGKDATSLLCPLNTTRFKLLDGKSYYSNWNLPLSEFEDLPFDALLIREIVKRDGGQGNFTVLKNQRDITKDDLKHYDLPQTPFWDYYRKCFFQLGLVQHNRNSPDFMWVYTPWESVIQKHYFPNVHTSILKFENRMPYLGYSPLLCYYDDNNILASDKDNSQDKNYQLLQKFMHATRRGYHFAIHNAPIEVTNLLRRGAKHPSLDGIDDVCLEECQRVVNYYYSNEKNVWGSMDSVKWNQWLSWLISCELLKDEKQNLVKHVKPDDFFTNAFFKDEISYH
ncbi:hypothetical protein ABK040_010877 [Willaertia magna]